MAIWSKARRPRSGDTYRSNDISAARLEVGRQNHLGRPSADTVGDKYLGRHGGSLGGLVFGLAIRGIIAGLVLYGMLTVTLSVISSNRVLNVSSLTVLESDRGERPHLEMALRRAPLFDVYADWSTEATVLSGSGVICPADTRLASGTARYEATGGSIRIISAEWLRRCLDVGPVELFAEWRVFFRIGPLALKMRPHQITQVISWETVKARPHD